MLFNDRLHSALLVAENKVDDKSEILTDLRDVSDALSSPITIIGGIAVAAHNYPRYTKDIDIIVKTADATKIANYLLETGKYENIGQNKLKHHLGVIINICTEGVKAGLLPFPPPQNESGVAVVSLPLLLALKTEANRYKDRADVVELIKRNEITQEYLQQQVIPLIRDQLSIQRITKLWDAANNEL